MDTEANRIHQGDALTVLRTLPDGFAHCCVTSPPYWGLRDYGIDGQLGLEPTPEEYVARLVEIFREVRRVLRDDGTLWLNLGDSYCAQGGGGESRMMELYGKDSEKCRGRHSAAGHGQQSGGRGLSPPGLKPKDLCGIPWRVALALQADGWYLRSDIIWHKPNPMPESVTDRPTKAHEYLFLLTKSARYFYDADAVREPQTSGYPSSFEKRGSSWHEHDADTIRGAAQSTIKRDGVDRGHVSHPLGRNRRTVWTIPTQPLKSAHFATFPPALAEPCILAGCPEGGIVLDPFFGAGTSGLVAKRLGRRYVGIELNPEYIALAEKRIAEDWGTPEQVTEAGGIELVQQDMLV